VKKPLSKASTRPLAYALLYGAMALFALCGPLSSGVHAAQSSVRAPAAAEGNPAADTDTAKAAAAKEAIKAGATPIAVEHEGTDSLGAKLAYSLKEIFNSGTLFLLSDKDVPKLRILIASASEFSDRPGVGSIYSIVWLYSERSNVLSNYLAHETGVVTADTVAHIADRLAARSAGLAAKHSYIFSK
jgi:hypothetical protein